LNLVNNASNLSGVLFSTNAAPATSYTYIKGDGRSSGFITLSTNDTERMRLDSSGNLGLGVTPSAWFSGAKVMQLGLAGAFYANTGVTQFQVLNNTLINASGNEVYLNNGYAQKYALNNSGEFTWFRAASGTAGNAITFTQAMTLDASGRLLLGTTTGSENLIVSAANARQRISSTTTTNAVATLYGNSNNYFYVGRDDSGGGYFNSGSAYAACLYSEGAYPMVFFTNATERMRIDSSGNLLVGKTSTSFSTAGCRILPEGSVNAVASNREVIAVNRLNSDGNLVEFYQDTTLEGSISVSGTTVSYNGGHLARYAQTTAAKDESLVKGTVLSNLDDMNTYTDAEGNAVDNEQLNKVKVSDVEGDVNVAGVFVNWSFDEQHNVDEINMAMTGDMIIRIAQGTTVSRGDLLMSAGDGTAKPQGDDIVRAKTIAKVTSTHVTCTYEDGSYCVPCVLMAC
jgi:hypothetical protein